VPLIRIFSDVCRALKGHLHGHGAHLGRGPWLQLLTKAAGTGARGAEELHLHDLRHFANTAVAKTGVPTEDLMAFMGHSSSRAALRHQHATEDAQSAIADAMGRSRGPKWPNGGPAAVELGHAKVTRGAKGANRATPKAAKNRL
jgi:integrase